MLYALCHTDEEDKMRDTIWNKPTLFLSPDTAKKAAEQIHADEAAYMAEDEGTPPAPLVWEESAPGHWYSYDEGTHIVVQPIDEPTE